MPIYRLCYKLAHYGICGCTQAELLTSISQQVLVNGKYSKSAEVTFGGTMQKALYWGHSYLSASYVYMNDIVHKISSII